MEVEQNKYKEEIQKELHNNYMEEIQKDLDKRFTHHPPKGNQVEKYTALRSSTKELAELFSETCPDSREKSLAITKLEEALMWANASIARNE